MKLRKLIRVTHRDMGYFFFAMTIIYAVSGIAMNHLEVWDPKYIVKTTEVSTDIQMNGKETSEEVVMQIVDALELDAQYKKHYFPNENTLKIFIRSGNAVINTTTGEGIIEVVKRRPVFGEFTYLHYDPVKYWTWFSDAFAVGLILLAITGLFMVKGKHSITRRGLIWTLAGIAIPVVYIILFM